MISIDQNTGDCESIDEMNAPIHFTLDQNVPNPCHEKTVIHYTLNTPNTVIISITNAMGIPIYTVNLGPVNTGSYRYYLDTSEFENGLYHYTFYVGAEKFTKSLVIAQ